MIPVQRNRVQSLYQSTLGCWMLLAIHLSSVLASAQQVPDKIFDSVVPQTDWSKPLSAEELEERKSKLKVALEKLRDSIKEVRTAEFHYYVDGFDNSDSWQDKHLKATVQGRIHKEELMDIAGPLLLHAPQLDEALLNLGKMMTFGLYDDYQYERSYQIAARLNQLAPDEDLQFMLMRTAMLTNRFEMAAAYREKVTSRINELPELELSMLRSLNDLIRFGQEEDKTRSLDKDLPLVELQTTVGRILLELYEDQYPNTVGQFVQLVESRFYDGMVFHRVSKNYLPFSIAQTGRMSLGEVPGSTDKAWFAHELDYRIRDESPADGNLRRHLRGTLSMMVQQDKERNRIPDSASSQFLITLVPSPAFDGNQVAFGRVVEGMEFVDRIPATLTVSEKDGKETQVETPVFHAILKASVIRKRDHEYKPDPVTR